jgi:protein-S-isoprenylcysteine O-methyltransferase
MASTTVSPDSNRDIHHRRVAQNTNDNASNYNAYSSSGPPVDSTLLPTGSRSLSFIGLQAWCLGNTFAGGLLLTIYLISNNSPWWRLPAFFTCLALFHFLEYYTTAHYNVPATRASSFLLFSNGSAYTTAHALATLEIVLSNFSSRYQLLIANPLVIAVGLILIIVGQIARSVAMAHAGTNFNHTIARERKESHVLVQDGIYAWLRHPSYFGFFWWALGTQLLVGNKICLLGYTVVLWRFFARRISGESELCGARICCER